MLYTKKDNNEGAIADFNAALKLDPREITAYINRGIVHRRKGELDKAIQDFTTAIKLLPDKIEPVQVKLVPTSTTSAARADDRRQEEAHRLRRAFVYFQRGLAWYDKTDYTKAIADFTESIRLNPQDAAPYVGRGASHMYRNDVHAAIADLQRRHQAVAGPGLRPCAARHRLSSDRRCRPCARRL